MTDEDCARVALALGPRSRRADLLSVSDPLCDLSAWWSHREAFGEWPPARDAGSLLALLRGRLERLERGGGRALLASDPGYPAALRVWPGAPAVIFIRGELASSASVVAVVGSRAASAGGLAAGRDLAAGLARSGSCVISGGAIGIDGAAHEGALAAGGSTVAVLGSGLERLYPERHLALFGRIAASGAVLSQFAPWCPPRRWQFPRRNELIARLAGVVVVVEAGPRSGALITARLAAAARVPVLARAGSAGTLRLLREGAGLVESAAEVLAVLEGARARRLVAAPDDLDARAALEHLRERGSLSVDELAALPGWRTPRAAAALMRLLGGGFVELPSGGRYALPRRGLVRGLLAADEQEGGKPCRRTSSSPGSGPAPCATPPTCATSRRPSRRR